MDECLVITIIYIFFKKKLIPLLNKKTESIKTINFFNMGRRFGISEKLWETEGKLKFGFA